MIELKNVSKYFGDTRVLDGVTGKVNRGARSSPSSAPPPGRGSRPCYASSISSIPPRREGGRSG
ncbi:hypothetical protein [Methanoculleus chikugoensis]|uniref:hypothetical protein n=1 Tax=Methanoculleus chikugoensis TaxID=118126 RepID=UPI000B29546F|nr:hypothetical protein [Methanoculleus chikugoensis]